MNLKETQPGGFASAELDSMAQFPKRLKLAGQWLSNIKQQLPKLEKLLAPVESHWEIAGGCYRFYHQSFKVYHVQQATEEIRKALQNPLPNHPMNQWFGKIIAEGTGREFNLSHNQDWLHHTRPMLEAFFHAHYFLKLAVKYGRELNSTPDVLPSGWVAVPCLFNLRQSLLDFVKMAKDISLTLGFSPVTSDGKGENRSNGFPRTGKPLKRLAGPDAFDTRLKPGANDRCWFLVHFCESQQQQIQLFFYHKS